MFQRRFVFHRDEGFDVPDHEFIDWIEWWPEWQREEDYPDFKNPARPKAVAEFTSTETQDLHEQYIAELKRRNLSPEAHRLIYKPTEKSEGYSNRAIAWEFLRRNVSYQRDWVHWKLAGYRAKLGNDEALWNRVRELSSAMCERYYLAPHEDPTNPFSGPAAFFAGSRSIDAAVLMAVGNGKESLDLSASAPQPTGPYITIRFSLDQPIGPQLAFVEQQFDRHRQVFRLYDKMGAREVRRPLGVYRTYLRLLDGKAAGIDNKTLAEIVCPGHRAYQRMMEALEAAERLVEGGYRRLIGEGIDADLHRHRQRQRRKMQIIAR